VDTIFTLNARGNIYLEVVREHFSLSERQVRIEILAMFRQTVRALAASGVDYRKLKSALVPSLDRNEVALIFDSNAIASESYGADVLAQVLPLLDPRSTQSIRVGDLIASDAQQTFVVSLLRHFLVQTRNFKFIHSTLLFAVYINNLSDTAVQALHNGLGRYDAYLGFIPTKYASVAKTFLSTTLADLCVKHGKIAILAHEDDRSNDENINITLYPFERFGYDVRSIQQHCYSHFLSYKIERQAFVDISDDDTHFSLNALSESIIPLHDMTVLIEDRKFDYLVQTGKLIKLGLAETSKKELTRLIQGKVAANYIYNLRYQPAHDTISFNIVVEIPHASSAAPTRLNVSLEYMPKRRTLRLITLY